MEVKVKLLVPNAVLPKIAHIGDAGADLTATSKWEDSDGNIVYGTGIAVEIPYGYVGLLYPRSSNAKKDMFLTNSVGIIDSCYRGEILMKYKHTPLRLADYPKRDKNGVMYGAYTPEPKEYEVGDRIGQLIIMPIPIVNYMEADELSDTDRGKGGYGSSGK